MDVSFGFVTDDKVFIAVGDEIRVWCYDNTNFTEKVYDMSEEDNTITIDGVIFDLYDIWKIELISK